MSLSLPHTLVFIGIATLLALIGILLSPPRAKPAACPLCSEAYGEPVPCQGCGA